MLLRTKNVSNEQQKSLVQQKYFRKKIQNLCENFRIKKVFGRTKKFSPEDFFVREKFTNIWKN